MKVVFIEPRSTSANVYSKISMPLLGPVYLGTILKDHGHDVTIYKEDIFTPDYNLLQADIVGISILTPTANRGYEIARKFPKEKVIMGGVHASLLPDEALKFSRQVVVGEAEDVILDVVEGRMREPIVYGRPVQDLDNLPYPDFTLIHGYKKTPVVTPISTSRGCPFDCSFCSVTKMFGRRYRFRSAENVIAEMSYRQARSFFFCDDNFAANPTRSRQLLDLMMRKKYGGWACQVRCDIAENKPLLDHMARAGCRLVCVGFESVNPKTLEAYQKNQTLGDIVNAIRSFHKRHIKVHGMFVLGGEDDNKASIWETLRFAVKEKIDTIQMSILTPFPGTKVHEELEKQNRIFSKDWSLYDGQHIVFTPKLLSARALQVNVLKAYAKFYSVYNSLVLLTRLRFRNAFFRLMGHTIVKDWIRRNRSMRWIAHEGGIPT
ncbi:MAG: Radical SAM superfamily protein [Syntrophorhabdaceae bacterium PtaU1.Bin034]|nr:MAG: Radical SAM superfamily protein [Syntrophorhabdaceae bacterium PtaU1.Bin034]